jgi:glycosyltransferase involved in cell wall biosynthesis
VPSGQSTVRTADRSAVSAIIPCLNEESAIGPCVAALLAHGLGEVIVVDGGSTDRTAERASAAGARVLIEHRRGYGRALLSGLTAVAPSTSIILFIDGDGSDRPEMVPVLLKPIEQGTADFVLGSRLRGPRERESLAKSQILAGHLVGCLIYLCYRVRFTDIVAVPGDRAPSARGPGHARGDVWMELGNADARRGSRSAHR